MEALFSFSRLTIGRVVPLFFFFIAAAPGAFLAKKKQSEFNGLEAFEYVPTPRQATTMLLERVLASIDEEGTVLLASKNGTQKKWRKQPMQPFFPIVACFSFCLPFDRRPLASRAPPVLSVSISSPG